MEYWITPIIVVVIVIAATCYHFVKKSNNRKAAQTGEDKARIGRALAPLIGEGDNYKILYAHWEKREHYGRTTKITYYRYAVMYKDRTLCIVPLYLDKKTYETRIDRPFVYNMDNLGKVAVNTTRKDDAVRHMDIQLSGKQGQSLFQLYVDAENLRSDRFHPYNIVQQEECEAFERFLTSLAERVDADNPGVDDMIKANEGASLGHIGAGLSIVGVVLGFIIPPAGIICAMIGLLMAVVGKVRGGKKPTSLIISIICAALCAVWMWLYLSNVYSMLWW